MKKLQSLALEQKENTVHGIQMFPLQKYVTTLSDTHPFVTAHWHEEAEFTLITEAECSYQINLEEYTLSEGDLILIPPLMLHSISNVRQKKMVSETYVFHMNFLGIRTADICSARYLTPFMNQELLLPAVIHREHPAYPALLELFRQISFYYAGNLPGYELMLKSLFLQVIFILLPYRSEKKDTLLIHNMNSDKLKAVLDYIGQNYAEELTIPMLADLCYFSEYHFMRFFKKHVGITCLEYINSLRLEKAAELFEKGESSVLEVSLAVGFHNLSYFYRVFKRKYGVTPKNYLSAFYN